MQYRPGPACYLTAWGSLARYLGSLSLSRWIRTTEKRFFPQPWTTVPNTGVRVYCLGLVVGMSEMCETMDDTASLKFHLDVVTLASLRPSDSHI